MEINFTIEEIGLIAHLVGRITHRVPLDYDPIVDNILIKIKDAFPNYAGHREWNAIYPGIYCADFSYPNDRIEGATICINTDIVTPGALRNYMLGGVNICV